MKRHLFLVLLAIATPSRAHELQAASLVVDETARLVRAVLKTPLSRDGAAVALVPRFPAGCTPASEPRVERQADLVLRQWSMRCPAGLAGGEIRLQGLDPRMPDAVVTVRLADGRNVTAAVNRHEPSMKLEPATRAPLPLAFFPLGIEHILLGADHLLFVLGLLLVVRAAGLGLGALVAALSSFTVAHSLTLALAALGVWGLPPKAVEVLIAGSIALLAFELASGVERRQVRESSLTFRAPWLVAFAFGLLHGFGFAGALAEIGLPAEARGLALLLFNLGVEAGQLAFIAAAIGAGELVRRLPRPAFAPSLASALVTLLGGVSTYWTLERGIAWLRSLS